MKTNKWYPAIAGGQQIAVRFIVDTLCINRVRVNISVPCRKGQYVLLYGVNQNDFTFEYYKGKCIISYWQSTKNVDCLEDLFMDIKIWFRYNYAIRMDEGLYTTIELLKVLG